MQKHKKVTLAQAQAPQVQENTRVRGLEKNFSGSFGELRALRQVKLARGASCTWQVTQVYLQEPQASPLSRMQEAQLVIKFTIQLQHRPVIQVL